MGKKWVFIISLMTIIYILTSCSGSSVVGTVTPKPTSSLNVISPSNGTHENPLTPVVSKPKAGLTIFKGFGPRDFNIRAILRDKNGNIWFSILADYQGTTVYEFNGVDWKHLDIPSAGHFNGDNTPIAIIQDNQGNLWFNTFASGVIKYDGSNFTVFTKDNGSLIQNSNSAMYKDSKGNIWIGTLGEAAQYFDGNNWHTFPLKYSSIDTIIYAIFQDKNGNMWFGTNAGLSVFDGENWRTFSEEYYGPASANPYHDIVSIFQDSDGNMWFGGSSGGVSRYDGKNWTNFKYDVSQYSRVNYITEDKNGILWFATQVNTGGPYYAVVRYDGTNWSTFTGEGVLPNGDTVQTLMYQDNLGNLWFTLNSGGVASYNSG